MMATKRRQRIILVCDNCHKRKIKCDRKLPCESCKSKGIGALCLYSALEKELAKQGKSSDLIRHGNEDVNSIVHLKNRIRELEASIGVTLLSRSETSVPTPESTTGAMYGGFHSPYGEAEGTTDLFSGFDEGNFNIRLSDTYICSFPLLFLAINKRDTAYKVFWHYRKIETKGSRFSRKKFFEGIGPAIDKDKELTKLYEAKTQAYFGDLYIPHYEKGKNDEIVKKAINQYLSTSSPAARYIIYYDNYIPPNTSIHLKATYLLPPKFIIMKYLTVWFDNLAPVFPVYEKELFTADVNRLINDRTDGDPRVKVSFESKDDLAILAGLFFLLRLTYIYLTRETPSYPVFPELHDFPLHVESVTLAKDFIKEFNLSTCKLFDVLQAFIIAKLYKTFAHEEGDGVRETDMYLQSLINSACQCGLNRDPDLYVYDNLSWIRKNHRRKVWFLLLMLETSESAIYSRCMYNIKQSDVNLEAINVPGDDCLYQAMVKILPIRTVLSELVELLLNINDPVSMKVLVALTSELEILINKNYQDMSGVLSNNLNGTRNFGDAINFYYFVSFKILLTKMNLCFYLIYEKRRDMLNSYYYFNRNFKLIYCELRPLLFIDAEKRASLDSVFSMYVEAVTIRFFFVSLITSITQIIHLECTLKQFKSPNDRPGYLIKLTNNLKLLCYHTLRYSGRVALDQYLAWKVTCIVTYFLSDLNAFQLIETHWDRQAAWDFSPDQLKNLLAITEETLAKSDNNSTPFKSDDDFKWLNVVSYDPLKTKEENLELQRLHLNQIDSLWKFHTVSLQETLPSLFYPDNSDNTQIPNLLNTEAALGDDYLGFQFPGSISFDDLFLGDGFSKF